MVIYEHLATKCPGALPPMPQGRIVAQHDHSRLRVGAARESVCGVTAICRIAARSRIAPFGAT